MPGNKTLCTIIMTEHADEMGELVDKLHKWAESKRAIAIERQPDGMWLMEFIVEGEEDG